MTTATLAIIPLLLLRTLLRSVLLPLVMSVPISRTMESVSTSSDLVSSIVFSLQPITYSTLEGLNILSTYKGSNRATATLSGTSMASPHTAGLLAYLLSIYPSAQFDPTFNEADDLISLQSQQYLSSSASSVYAIARASLPRWISSFLPDPALLETVNAPIPKTLTPKQLKTALIALATKGVISDLPAKTVNLLIFNNATTA